MQFEILLGHCWGSAAWAGMMRKWGPTIQGEHTTLSLDKGPVFIMSHGCDNFRHSWATVWGAWQLLLLHRFSRVQLCATPQMEAHQAPPSLGFSRQEHWSGLPFPSPVHENEKWKWSRSVVSDSVIPWTTAYQAPSSMGFSRQEYWSGVPLPSPEVGRDGFISVRWNSITGSR